MTVNRRTGSGSDLAGTENSTATHFPEPMNSGIFQAIEDKRLSEANRPGRYRFLFCGRVSLHKIHRAGLARPREQASKLTVPHAELNMNPAKLG